MNGPWFFSFDGLDGAGKSTQISLFANWLTEQGSEVVTCRDPGSTPMGEAVRQILLDRKEMPIARRSEMLLYMAARAQLVEEVIRPALADGKTVISDRFLLANIVYQAHGGQLDRSPVAQVGQIATDGVSPGLTFVLDVDLPTMYTRLNNQHDRMESQGEAFFQRVRAGFLREAEANPSIEVVNAMRPADQIQAEIQQIAQHWMNQ